MHTNASVNKRGRFKDQAQENSILGKLFNVVKDYLTILTS